MEPSLIGKTLAHYEVIDALGAGGMGEVYRARDTQLDREVALKFLPAALVRDAEHLARFEREAKLLASLSHPNIAVVYGLHEVEDSRFLAMELVPGEDLTHAIEQGPVPVAEAVGIAVQVGEALSTAHENQVIHRDLKPANIMLTPEGRAKVLDFGLAKSTDQNASSSNLSHNPTMSTPATLAGVILGTASYMSPEQARGKIVDRRTDIWSFGCVLYEMLSGERPFPGETVTDVIASIIHKEPNWDAIPKDVPPGVVRVLKKCLSKDATERYRDAADVGLLLNDALTAPEPERIGAAAPEAAQSRKRSLLWPGAAVAFAAIAVVTLMMGGFGSNRGGDGNSSLAITGLERLTDLPGLQTDPSLSADGRFVLYSAPGPRRDRDIFVQRVGGEIATNLTEQFDSEDFQPAFSPDGERIAFGSFREGGGIFIMGATGESPIRLSDGGFDPQWSPDGSKIAYTSVLVANPYARSRRGVLWTVDVDSGEQTRITTDEEIDAVDPAWSPSGTRIAFTSAWSGVYGQRDIWTISASGGEATPVIQDKATDWGAVWSPSGEWLYFMSHRNGPVNLWRIRIDESTGKALGEPERVTSSPFALRSASFSQDGSLAALEIRTDHNELQIASFDPVSLRVLSEFVPLPAGRAIATATLSPDGQRITYMTNFPGEYIHVIGADGTGRRRLTNDIHRNRGPVWTPDGRWITFYSNRRGARYEVFVIRPDGTEMQVLSESSGSLNSPNWTRDWKVFFADPRTSVNRVGMLDIGDWGESGPLGPYPAEPLSGSDGVFFPHVSPSGKHVYSAGLDTQGEFQGQVFEVESQESWFIEYQGRTVTPGHLGTWLDDFRYLTWVSQLQQAIVVDVRDRSVVRAPDVPGPGNLDFSERSRKLLRVTDDEDADLWLLRLGGGSS